MTMMSLILMDEANGVRIGDLKHWGLNVWDVYIEDENETKFPFSC